LVDQKTGDSVYIFSHN
jgi:hypothetical protein